MLFNGAEHLVLQWSSMGFVVIFCIEKQPNYGIVEKIKCGLRRLTLGYLRNEDIFFFGLRFV